MTMRNSKKFTEYIQNVYFKAKTLIISYIFYTFVGKNV